MEALINITTNKQGLSVVSARELYEFLGYDKSQWRRWSKKNIENNQFALEKTDWEGFDIMSSSNNGIPTKDYALSLDFAKRISMMSRTDSGEQIRNYFIECERQVKEAINPKTQIEALLASVQMLAQQEQRLSLLENKFTELEESRNVATEQLLLAERSTEDLPEETLRMKIRKLINQYCRANNADHPSVWNVVYDRLYYRYGVNLKAVLRNRGETWIEAAERLGHLEKIFVICSSELV